MIADRKALLDAAMELPEEDRAEMAQRLFDSLPESYDVVTHLDPTVREAWRDEIRKRVDELEAGEAEMIPSDVVFREIREKMQK